MTNCTHFSINRYRATPMPFERRQISYRPKSLPVTLPSSIPASMANLNSVRTSSLVCEPEALSEGFAVEVVEADGHFLAVCFAAILSASLISH